MNDAPVGFFDSGLGGLCILDAFKRLCPAEDTIYLADSAHCPYGNRTTADLISLSESNTAALLSRGCKMIVVACNTATAAAIETLRAHYPNIPFIGIEPAIKPAALQSKRGIVGVLATAGTFNGRLYNETKSKFAHSVTVLASLADEFIPLVERGETQGPHAEQIVRAKVEPLLNAGADYLVLGCTHFPHLAPLIEKIAAGRAQIIEPSHAVARQAERILHEKGLATSRQTPSTSHIFIRT